MTEPEKKVVVNYPGNTNKARASASQPSTEKPKVEKVVKGEIVQRKKPLSKRIAETFTGEDASSVGSYVLFEVMIPAAKATISEVVSTAVERMLFGDSRPRTSGYRGGNNYTSYNRMHKPADPRERESRSMSQAGRASHNFDEVILEDRGEAEHVLDRLTDLVNQYDVATVADLYSLVGVTGSFTDDKWGWTDLRSAGIRRVSGGYLLNLPRPEPIR